MGLNDGMPSNRMPPLVPFAVSAVLTVVAMSCATSPLGRRQLTLFPLS